MSQQVRPTILMIKHGHLRININCERKELVKDYTQVGLSSQPLDIWKKQLKLLSMKRIMTDIG
jgi:hypothetical protein